ncbi:phosphonate C-P lyase system protein PhnG [Halobacillus halophilus]|uniref:phosphonate C-P lyase system protein PhnG n=1 Tax=Halobacillus halophilus TaxID=1570 RepID=UPI001CD78122|nr:phosphonate C-P lyase system protein PhnG [Halobacillus halophilus]MCA1011963.1 phosphonate C-P lyase system protein PhnG [Halobacillus halophilus]
MKKKRLTRILVEGRDELAESMAEEIEKNHAIYLDKQPQKSLVMLKNKDSVSNQPFYAGEVLVTECGVSIDDKKGIGVIMGERPEKAYHLAVIDAALNVRLKETESWGARLLEEEEAIHKRHQGEAVRAARTKVNFDTMEDYDD